METRPPAFLRGRGLFTENDLETTLYTVLHFTTQGCAGDAVRRRFMSNRDTASFNIALVGGGELCKEVLEKTNLYFKETDLGARICAVADPDPNSPGILLAKKLGLMTFKDYRDLYQPQYDIKAMVLLTPEGPVLKDILETKPYTIRLLSHEVFLFLWRIMEGEQQKVRKRNEEIETILNSIQDFILVITPDMEIVEVNQAFLDQMGYSREEVIGRKCHEVFQKINRQCNSQGIVCPLQEVIRNKRPSQQVLKRLDHDGQSRYVEVTVFPIWEKGGVVSKFIEISRDITDRRRQEEEITGRLEKMVADRTRELEETHAKLLHEDKVASLGKLAASVVHEINNPISGILNLIMLIKRIMEEGPINQKEGEQFSQYLKLMEMETRRISRIVSDLLAFSRQSKMEFRRLNLNHLIEKTLFLNANFLKIHSVKVQKKLDPDLPDIAGSEDQLQQVFMNLVSNAAEAIDGAGGQRFLRIETKYLPSKGKVVVSFKDSGIGIPAENLPMLFEPFFTTKKKGKGVGLGLPVAYGIIQGHGGSIHVQSKEGKGTTFTLEFPLKSASNVLEKHGGLHGHS